MSLMGALFESSRYLYMNTSFSKCHIYVIIYQLLIVHSYWNNTYFSPTHVVKHGGVFL